MTETSETPETAEMPDTAMPETESPAPLPIVMYPAPFLRTKTKRIAEIDDDVRSMVERMIETMVEARGIGLAATQVGWDAQVCIVSDSGEPDDCFVLINPEVEETWGSEAMEEGCLSFPGINAVITRAQGVRVKFTGLDGEEYELEDDDLLGRCCLHEIDHLNGVTFLSKMTPADKLANRRALKRLEERARADNA
jgi:peptide deformylase